MSLKAIHILLAICVVALLSTTANAQQSAPYFSNEDIEKYKSPSDYKTYRTKTEAVETKKKAEKTKEQKEKEYWCKRATEYRKKIEKAQGDVEETEKKLAELEGNTLPGAKSKKALKQLDSKLRKSKKHLRNAERDLSDFEDEAHRKGIPPGWLRCQFDW
jgi:predicted  nucleic acid-binding Zn-ribbon protein